MSEQKDMGKHRGTVKKKERWLLTRKTWRYMADAGRKLIPDGSQDLPKIERYFQEVCQAEPRFLLWRKASYPGALGFRSHHRRHRSRKKCGSCREKASSADEAEELKTNPSGAGLFLTPTSPGRFDLLQKQDIEEKLLESLKNMIDFKSFNHQELFDKLEQYLNEVQKEERVFSRSRVISDSQRELLGTLRRYYRSPNRESVISDILTERKLLEKLYFELRRTRNFRGAGTAYFPEWRSGTEVESPPLVEILEATRVSKGVQLPAMNPAILKAIKEKKKPEEEPKATSRRRSSVDHDDISPSVGDTIKRYLKMARKKSMDAEKSDRFKTINYDKNLKNIKGKGVPMPGDDDGLNKGAQTEESWQEVIKTLEGIPVWDGNEWEVVEEPEMPAQSSNPAPSAKGLLSTGQSFLSNLFQGLQLADKSPVVMQKSKSSSSVGRSLVSKKIWRGRSKSQGRVASAQSSSWSPQGNCTWVSLTGRQVCLTDTCILQLSEIERRLLQKVALAKLQALNLGCNIIIPSEVGSAVPSDVKPKRRPHLLKRKAITTGFFDTSRTKEKENTSTTGLVFGIPLAQCVENDRLSRRTSTASQRNSATFPLNPEEGELALRRRSHHGSRSSFTSLIDSRTIEESAGSSESLGGSVPGLLDNISVGSTAEAALTLTESKPSVPYIVSSCLKHIENYGMHILGIFRVSSSKKRVRQLREDYDSGKDVVLGEECCPHDVATLLKEFFRDLPEPLLCKDLYRPFLLTQKIRNRRLQFEALQHLIQLLPVPHRDTLWSLLNFLSLVAANSDDHENDQGETVAGNKMDSNNLATLFAPNILHPPYNSTSTTESSDERLDVINVVRSMIDHNKDLFQVTAELLDEVYVHMMDTHPESLDQLLRKRDVGGEENVEDLEDESEGSMPQTPGASSGSETQYEKRFSRELLLHADMHLCELDPGSRRYRVHGVKKKTREGKRDDDGQQYDLETSGVIKASLTLPTSFALNLDDTDIPFIEDATSSLSETSRTPGTNRKPSITIPHSRQRSLSGSESSQTSTPVNLQPITGCLPLMQNYDSAVGSSATYSSPPRGTTTPSVCSSSDREYFSSPPSWTSSPPLSPDSQKSGGVEESRSDWNEEKRPGKAEEKHMEHRNIFRDLYQKIPTLTPLDVLPKSASSSQLIKRPEEESQTEASSSSRKPTTSISNIGGAVLRSKTADIERMLKIKPDSKKQTKLSKTEVKPKADSSDEEKKKHAKRRYTESRHQTRTLTEVTETSRLKTQSVWKRRELISSPLQDNEDS